MKIDKSDIETLDFIIDKISEMDSEIRDGFLKEIEKYNNFKISDIKFESNRIMNIIESYGCAKVTRLIRGNTIEKNENTKKFKEHGGFAKIYQDELDKIAKENERDTLSMKKLKWDAQLSKWQVKTFWPVFAFGLIGFIFGIFNFIDNRTKTKSIEELQQSNSNIQEEVSILRTLVLDKQNLDTLHSSKTHVDFSPKK